VRLTKTQRTFLWLWSLLCFAAAFTLLAYQLRNTYGAAHQVLLDKGARYGPPLTIYVQCLFINTRCSEWYGQVTTFHNSNTVTVLFVLAVIPLGVLLAARSKEKIYTARFEDLDELKSLRFPGDLLHPRLAFAIMIGHYHPVPDQQPQRDQVLTGEALPNLDYQVLALASGYGERSEVGHGAIFGGIRSGKSIHLTGQSVMWRGSLVTLDIKGELYAATAGYRATLGDVFVLSPDGRGHRFDAISEILKHPNGALTAGTIITAPQLSQRPEFAQRAAGGLAALFQAAVERNEPPLELAATLVQEGGIEGFFAAIGPHPSTKVQSLVNIFLGMSGGRSATLQDTIKRANEDRFLTSAWALLMVKLAPFMTDEVRHSMSGNDFEAADFMKRPRSVYLVFPETTLAATTPIYNMFVTGLHLGMTSYFDAQRIQNGKRWMSRVPVLFGFDELAHAPITGLPSIISTASGRNISVLMYLQSPAQLETLYGESDTKAILESCGVQLYYKMESLETAKYLNQRSDKVSVPSRSISRVVGNWLRGPTVSSSSYQKDVLTIDEALRLGGEKRHMILANVSGKRPILVKRFNYYDEPIAELLDTPAPPIPQFMVGAEAAFPDDPPDDSPDTHLDISTL
jgi:type IV secretory pathway TraG/TraD family ATPase VirD4